MKELLRRLRSRPGILAELLASSLLINILGLASTVFVMLVLNRYVPYGVDATLATLSVGVVLAALLEFGFREARRRLALAVTAPGDAQRAEAAFAMLTQARLTVLERLSPAARQEVVRSLDVVERTFTPNTVGALFDVPFSLVTLLALYFLSPALGLIATLGMAACWMVTVAGEHINRSAVRQASEGETAAQTALTAITQAADTVRAFNATGMVFDGWRAVRTRLRAVREGQAAAQGLAQSLIQAVSGLQGVAIIAVGAVLCVRGDLSTGALIGANILAARALGPISRLVGLMEPLSKADLALRRFEEFMRLPLENATGMAIKDYSGRLEFADLAFAYPGAVTPLVEHLSLRLEPGQVLVVTGPNGAGKTTLARLIMGLVEPVRGQVLVDGVELRQLGLEWWRRQTVYLPQEPVFLDGTIAENIRVANPALDDEELSAILSAAGLRPWLDSTAQGLSTPIVEGGRTLALGVRRRLALARGLATDGRLVLLDEPTEGLDDEGKAALWTVMNDQVRRGRTMVVLTNDPGSIRGAHWLLDLGVKPVPRLSNGAAASTKAKAEAAHA